MLPTAFSVGGDADLSGLKPKPADADLLSDLRTGVEVELLGRTASGDWLLVRIISTGVEGWVLAELLEYDAPASRVPVLPIGTPIGAAGP